MDYEICLLYIRQRIKDKDLEILLPLKEGTISLRFTKVSNNFIIITDLKQISC